MQPRVTLGANLTYRQSQLIRIGLGLTLLLAVALRFYRLAGQSLWADEGNSITLARAGLGEIAARTALDIHPPLYYWLLHGWIRLFGQSEVAVRLLSAVAGVLLVAVVFRLGVRLLGERGGLLAALIAAVSPFQIYYAQETRMYALLALLGALTVWASAEIMAASSTGIPRDWMLLYGLSATLGLYTHYAFPVVLVAANVAILVHSWQSRASRQSTQRWLSWLGLQFIPLALYAPWLSNAWRQLTTWPMPSTQADNALLTLWRTLILGPTNKSGDDWWLLGFGLLGLVGVVRLARQARLPTTLLVVLYLGLPVGLTLALFKPAYLKFLLVASPAACLILAVGLVGGRTAKSLTWPGWIGAALALAAAWGPLTTYYSDPAVARDDYRGMARYLAAVAGPGDAIILNAAGQQDVFGYYYRGEAPVYPLPRRRPLDPQATLAELERVLARSRHIYALYWATDESDPAGIIEGWLDESAFKAVDAWVGNVRLVSYASPLPAGDLATVDLRLGDHIRLTGYQILVPSLQGLSSEAGLNVAPRRTVPGEIVQVQLCWTTDAPLEARYVVFLQLLDAANHLAGQRDAEPVVSSLEWKPGQPVLDRHGLLVEPGTPPGEYRVIVGLYDAVTGQRLSGERADFLELGTLVLERPPVPPPLAALRFRHPANADFGPLRLLGYDLYKLGYSHDPQAPLHPADPLHIVLYWQVQDRPQTEWRVALQMTPIADSQSPMAEGVYPAAGLGYPTTDWEPGEVVRAQFDFFLPADARPGNYRLSLRLLDKTGSGGTDEFWLIPISVQGGE